MTLLNVTDTGATQANVSNHLRVLRRAGMIVLEPRGRSPTTVSFPRRWRAPPDS
ncbi:ArsR/SmtB family transcription factor [Luedemannella flava]